MKIWQILVLCTGSVIILYTKPFAMICSVLFHISNKKILWCKRQHFGLPCSESRVQILAELILNKQGFCSFFFKIVWFLMIFISFSSPWTKTIILLLHSVKVLEPYRIQSAHVQGYVKLKMDSVEGWNQKRLHLLWAVQLPIKDSKRLILNYYLACRCIKKSIVLK